MTESIAVTAIHWTQKLRAENTVLREALEKALNELTMIPYSRLEKERQYPHEDAEVGQAYHTCAQEAWRLGHAAVGSIRDDMAEKGVL